MPEISLFYGIRVTMYYNDHMPPHFHAEYNGHKALVDINNIQVIKGSLPNKQLRLILAWVYNSPGRIDAELGAVKGHEAVEQN